MVWNGPKWQNGIKGLIDSKCDENRLRFHKIFQNHTLWLKGAHKGQYGLNGSLHAKQVLIYLID